MVRMFWRRVNRSRSIFPLLTLDILLITNIPHHSSPSALIEQHEKSQGRTLAARVWPRSMLHDIGAVLGLFLCCFSAPVNKDVLVWFWPSVSPPVLGLHIGRSGNSIFGSPSL
jgi:hypothetical protein